MSCHLTFNEIVKSIVSDILKDPDELMILKSYKKEDLIKLHHSFGQWIRKNYNLWSEDNPLTEGYGKDQTKHPDYVSQLIIESVWNQLIDLDRCPWNHLTHFTNGCFNAYMLVDNLWFYYNFQSKQWERSVIKSSNLEKSLKVITNKYDHIHYRSHFNKEGISTCHKTKPIPIWYL